MITRKTNTDLAGPSARSTSGTALRLVGAAALVLLLSACANQIDTAVSQEPGSPGFLWGLWHGFIFPWAWIGSLFSPDIAVYAVPNKGWSYDAGFFLGITVLGGGSFFGSKSRKD